MMIAKEKPTKRKEAQLSKQMTLLATKLTSLNSIQRGQNYQWQAISKAVWPDLQRLNNHIFFIFIGNEIIRRRHSCNVPFMKKIKTVHLTRTRLLTRAWYMGQRNNGEWPTGSMVAILHKVWSAVYRRQGISYRVRSAQKKKKKKIDTKARWFGRNEGERWPSSANRTRKIDKIKFDAVDEINDSE